MPLAIVSPAPIMHAKDGVLHVNDSRRLATIPDTATAAAILPVIYMAGIRLRAIPGKRFVVAEVIKW